MKLEGNDIEVEVGKGINTGKWRVVTKVCYLGYNYAGSLKIQIGTRNN